MRRFLSAGVSIVLTLAIFFNSLPVAYACGPFTIDPLFSFSKHTDYPLKESIARNAAIVPETYGKASLFVFYRQLNGLTLTPEDQKQVAEVLTRRIGTREGEESTGEPKGDKPAGNPSGFDAWQAERTKAVSGEAKIETEKRPENDYSYYTNCLDDAFKTAADTLKSRTAKYGAGNDVKEWVEGQDAVFSNCGGNAQMPENAPASAPDWLKRDRQYQMAAALFYQDKFAEARGKFQQIAADSGSEWKTTAKFVVARTYIREASFIDDETEDANLPQNSAASSLANMSASNVAYNASVAANSSSRMGNMSATANINASYPPVVSSTPMKPLAERKREKVELLKKAEGELRNVLADNSAVSFHESAHRLLSLVNYRSNPLQQRKYLAGVLAQPAENKNIFNDLTDYVWLMDKVDSEASEKGIPLDEAEAKAQGKEYDYAYRIKLRDVPQGERSEDLTDWLVTYQAEDGFAHAYAKWKEKKNIAWLTAAISKVAPKAPEVNELLAEAAKLKSDSPAFATVRYYQIQVLLESERRAEARQLLDQVIATDLNKFPRSTQNKFFAQRMILAENLDEFLKYAQRKAAAFVWSDDGNEAGTDDKSDKNVAKWTNLTMFDTDAVAFINEKMPLSVMKQAAQSPQLPVHLKKFFVQAVWTRAVILGNQEVEREMTPLMQQYVKEFAPSLAKYASATSPVDKRAGAFLVILRNPVIQPYVPVGMGRGDEAVIEIDSIRGNWWCQENATDDSDRSRYDRYPFEYPAVYPNFLTPAQAAAGVQEHKAMIETGNSSTFLARKAVEFANQNPTNPDTPEILALAVRSTRYGCKDDDTLQYSKAAFDILHKRFPKNAWTAKTPYYFGNN